MTTQPGAYTPEDLSRDRYGQPYAAGLKLTSAACPECGMPVAVECGDLSEFGAAGFIDFEAVLASAQRLARVACPSHDGPVQVGARTEAPRRMHLPIGAVGCPADWTPERIEEFKAEWNRFWASGEAFRHRVRLLPPGPRDPFAVVEIEWTEDGEQRRQKFGPWLTASDDSHLAAISGFACGWRIGKGVEPEQVTLTVGDESIAEGAVFPYREH